MDLKTINKQLKILHEKIKQQGHLSPSDEQELQALMEETLHEASSQIETVQEQLQMTGRISIQPGNDNRSLSPDQLFRLSLMEKTGTGSNLVH